MFKLLCFLFLPLLSVGGVVIFDDVMSHRDVMRFWNDFQKDYNIDIMLNRIDDHSAWFIKDKEIVMNPALKGKSVRL